MNYLVSNELFNLALKERNKQVNDLENVPRRFKKSDIIKGCELEINYKNIK